MADELTYVLITPYSLHKSRTGGILSRLLSLTNLDFVDARMYRFSDALASQYAETFKRSRLDPAAKELFYRYCTESLQRDNPRGISNRALVLFFRGPDAVRHLQDDVIGPLTHVPQGDKVRWTYGDSIVGAGGTVTYFEPAVITGGEPAINREQLALLDQYAESDGGVVEDAVRFPAAEQARVQTTLVIIKPDNFDRPSRRPGGIIDVFAATGCSIVGAKLFSFSINQALEFYGPLEQIFVEKLAWKVTDALKTRLGPALEFPIPDASYAAMTELLKHPNATHEFFKIVEYMTGLNPARVTDPEGRHRPGPSKCLALLYRGPDAVDTVRSWLGSTDPRQADPGTVRSDFGRDLMRNAAHASDSIASAEQERKIIGLWQTQDATHLHRLVAEFLGRPASAGRKPEPGHPRSL